MIAAEDTASGIGEERGVEHLETGLARLTAIAFGAENKKGSFGMKCRHKLRRQHLQILRDKSFDCRLRPDHQRNRVQRRGKLTVLSEIFLRQDRVPFHIDVDVSLHRRHR